MPEGSYEDHNHRTGQSYDGPVDFFPKQEKISDRKNGKRTNQIHNTFVMI